MIDNRNNDDASQAKLPRLQVALAERGVASRRGAADIIATGRVRVNGEIVREPGARVDPVRDRIEIDGISLPSGREPTRTILLYKPAGLVCSADSSQGATVCDLVAGLPERLVPVGRLDKESEGLLLLSNDGRLIEFLTHPRHGHIKRYEVEVTGFLDERALDSLREPIEIDGRDTRPARVELLRRSRAKNGAPFSLLSFEIGEGRNRQIRRLCERAGLRVRHLVRVSLGGLSLGRLRPGEWRDLRQDEIDRLLTRQQPTTDKGTRHEDRLPHSRIPRNARRARDGIAQRPHRRS